MIDFFIIDASSFLYKSYFALPKLTTSKGEEVGALYGFTRLIVNILRKGGRYIVVCYDSKTNKRKIISKDYKANRAKIDDELIKQIERSKEIVSAFGIKFIEVEGYEADDIIASIVKKFSQNMDIRMIITGCDKDLMQLVGDNVFIWDGKNEYLDRDYVIKKYGVEPQKIRDLLVLTGDASDNIKGVSGIGPKTAAKLLNTYGSLENILKASAESQSDKYLSMIHNQRDVVETAHKLATPCYIEVDGDIDDFLVRFETDKVSRLLFDLEFRNIVNELGISVVEKDDIEIIDFDRFYSFDIDYISVFENDIIWDKWCVEFEKAKKLIFQDGIKKYFYNVKDIFQRLLTDKITDYDDIMIAYHLVYGGVRKPDIHRIIEEFFSVRTSHPALYFERIMKILDKKIDDYSMRGIYNNELFIAKILWNMEKNGVRVDSDYLFNLRVEYQSIIDSILVDLRKRVGYDINPASPKQVSELIFKKLNLKLDEKYEKLYKTKSGSYSTSEDVLKLLMPYNPEIISLVLKYREYLKFLSLTENLISEVRDGRIYSHFDQVSTSTGRIQSYSPNLQNIPIKTSDGAKIRNVFIADDGYSIVSFDYSQIDLRVIAHLSGDELLLKAFIDGNDIHRQTASFLFGVSSSDVDDYMRRIAKAVNFGIIYGLSPLGLSVELGVDYDTASKYIERYFKMYSGIKRWIDQTIDFARKNGYVSNFFGRRRYVSDINSKNRSLRLAAERVAVNMPVQSASSDIIKKAMVDIYHRFNGDENIKPLIQIHDELVFEIKDEVLNRYIPLIKDIMESACKIRVPLVVNVRTAKRWGEID